MWGTGFGLGFGGQCPMPRPEGRKEWHNANPGAQWRMTEKLSIGAWHSFPDNGCKATEVQVGVKLPLPRVLRQFGLNGGAQRSRGVNKREVIGGA